MIILLYVIQFSCFNFNHKLLHYEWYCYSSQILLLLSYLDRHNEFLKLENSIREVYELFMELSQMVEQQGESINRIEALVEDAGERVHSGKEEIIQAHVYQTKARKKKFIIAVILIVIIVLVIVIAASSIES